MARLPDVAMSTRGSRDFAYWAVYGEFIELGQ